MASQPDFSGVANIEAIFLQTIMYTLTDLEPILALNNLPNIPDVCLILLQAYYGLMMTSIPLYYGCDTKNNMYERTSGLEV
jgi:hypothetical protein